jgi:hypothetical protein
MRLQPVPRAGADTTVALAHRRVMPFLVDWTTAQIAARNRCREFTSSNPGCDRKETRARSPPPAGRPRKTSSVHYCSSPNRTCVPLTARVLSTATTNRAVEAGVREPRGTKIIAATIVCAAAKKAECDATRSQRSRACETTPQWSLEIASTDEGGQSRTPATRPKATATSQDEPQGPPSRITEDRARVMAVVREGRRQLAAAPPTARNARGVVPTTRRR